MAVINTIADMTLIYRLTNGNSGRTKVRFGTMVALEIHHKKSFSELGDVFDGAAALATVLWLQLNPGVSLDNKKLFADFYPLIETLDFEIGDLDEPDEPVEDGGVDIPKLEPVSTRTPSTDSTKIVSPPESPES